MKKSYILFALIIILALIFTGFLNKKGNSISSAQNKTNTNNLELKQIANIPLGGGASELTAVLLEQGADAYAVDPRYKSRSDLKGRARLQIEHIKSHGDRGYYLEAVTSLEHCMESMKTHTDHYRVAFASNLPFPDNYFDFVFSSGVILGYLDVDYRLLQATTEEALRVTRLGGTIQLHPYEVGNTGHGPQVQQFRTNSLQRWTHWLENNPAVNSRIEPSSRGDRRVVIQKLS